MLGLSGISNDLRDIEDAAADGDEQARLKLTGTGTSSSQVHWCLCRCDGWGRCNCIYRRYRYSALIRHRVAQRLEFLGARIDEDRNRSARVSRDNPVAEISDERSRVRILVVATDEERAIAQETEKIVQSYDRVSAPKGIPLAVSARHVHLTQRSR